MQPAPIYKALLTFWNTATDMLAFLLVKNLSTLGSLSYFEALYTCVCVCVCVYICQPEGHFPQSVLQSAKSKAR